MLTKFWLTVFWYGYSWDEAVAPAHDLSVAISEAKFKVDSNSAKVSLCNAQYSDCAMIWSNSETSSSSCLISISNWTPGVKMVSSSTVEASFAVSEFVELGLVRITCGVRLCWPKKLNLKKKI